MKARLSYIILLFVLSLNMTAQTVNARKEASRMSQRADGIMYELRSLSSRDSLRYFRNIIDIVDYSLKSDKYDMMPDRKGRVKLRHADDNAKRLIALRPSLIDAGLYFASHRYRHDGVNAWKLYLKASRNHLLKDDKGEDETALAAYYIAQSELEERNYKSADRFADIALKDDDVAQYAAEIKAQCMHDQMVNRDDSAKYLSVLIALYKSDTSNAKYFAWLMRFYSNPNKNFSVEKFIDTELVRNPNSPVPWIMKGENAMRAKRWDEAVDAYKHADDLDSLRVPVIYNIGICIINKAVEERSEFKPTRKSESRIQQDVKRLYAQSEQYFDRVRRLDPHRKTVDWVTPLYRVYLVLGDEDKARELKPLIRR